MNQLNLYEQNKPRTLDLLRKEARHLCYKYGFVTADTLRDHIGDAMPSWLDMRIIGAALMDRKMFIAGDFVKTKRKTSHGRYIRRFTLNRNWKKNIITPSRY